MSTNNKSEDKKEAPKYTLLKDVTVGSGKKAKTHKKGSKIELPKEALDVWRRKHRIE